MLAVQHKDRVNKIGRSEGVLGHQAATPVVAAESAWTLAQELGVGVGEIHTASLLWVSG